MLPTLTCGLSLSTGDNDDVNYSAYANQTQLQVHFLDESQKIATTVDSKMFICTNCGRQYKLRKTLNRHMRHECGKDKAHICPVCDYRTYRNDRLLSHLRSSHPAIAPSAVKRGALSKIPKIINVESISDHNF